MSVVSKDNPCNLESPARGFTLIELMVSIMVATIVALYGVPAMKQMIDANRLTARTNQLVHSLFLARSEAVKRNQPVSVCASGVKGDDDTGIWKDGWSVKHGKDCLDIQPIESIGPGDSGTSTTTSINRVTFYGDGTTDSPPDTAFVLVNARYTPDVNLRRVVELTVGGAVHSCKPGAGNNDCEAKD